MRILALADVESPALWDYFNPERLKDIDVILSCGDLDPRYLSFLATFFSGPVLYVHGNHDGFYDRIPPEGCMEMNLRIIKLWLPLKIHRGFDVLVAHAPAKGLGDGEDLPHAGFKGFLTLMEAYRPAFMVHGHVHLSYNPLARRVNRFRETTVINAYEKYVFEIDESALKG